MYETDRMNAKGFDIVFSKKLGRVEINIGESRGWVCDFLGLVIQ